MGQTRDKKEGCKTRLHHRQNAKSAGNFLKPVTCLSHHIKLTQVSQDTLAHNTSSEARYHAKKLFAHPIFFFFFGWNFCFDRSCTINKLSQLTTIHMYFVWLGEQSHTYLLFLSIHLIWSLYSVSKAFPQIRRAIRPLLLAMGVNHQISLTKDCQNTYTFCKHCQATKDWNCLPSTIATILQISTSSRIPSHHFN